MQDILPQIFTMLGINDCLNLRMICREFHKSTGFLRVDRISHNLVYMPYLRKYGNIQLGKIMEPNYHNIAIVESGIAGYLIVYTYFNLHNCRYSSHFGRPFPMPPADFIVHADTSNNTISVYLHHQQLFPSNLVSEFLRWQLGARSGFNEIWVMNNALDIPLVNLAAISSDEYRARIIKVLGPK